MQDFKFTTTDDEAEGIEVPYVEDARADFAPYYASNKTPQEAKAEIKAELAKLEAYVTRIQEGYFGGNTSRNPRRYGYQIFFVYKGAQGVIRVAGLPIRASATSKKVEQVRTQALLIVRDWVKTWITQRVFNPGADPLIQFLLVDGQHTVNEHIRRSGQLPAQIAQEDNPIVDGEFSEL